MRNRGFTIVELLIVIVVIAILAAVTVVAFNGIQQRSKNTSIESGVSSYRKILSLYKESYGSYAIPGNGILGYCLGEASSYPSNCYSASADATFANELRKVVTNLPVPDKDCVTYSTTCRRNFTLLRQTSWTVDGQLNPYYLIYHLRGATACSLPNSLEGSWGNFSTTQTKGYFERSLDGATMCIIQIPNL